MSKAHISELVMNWSTLAADVTARSSALYDVIESSDGIEESIVLEDLDRAAASGGADVNFLCKRRLPNWTEEDYTGTGKGNSALHLACWKRVSKVIIGRLVELGADVNLKNSDGDVPLHIACDEGLDRDIVELLLDSGARVDEMTRDENTTSLHCSAFSGHRHITELLLDRGANIHGKDARGGTPLSAASRAGNKNICELLLNRGANANDPDYQLYSPLMEAAYDGHLEVLILLLDRGADINAKGEEGDSALFWGCQEGKGEIVKILLDRGCEIYDVNNLGCNCLHIASIGGHKEIVQLLLSRGVNAHDRITGGFTALSVTKDELTQSGGNEGHANVIDIIEKWSATMWVIVLEYLGVYNYLDATSLEDIFEYIGSEDDYLSDADEWEDVVEE